MCRMTRHKKMWNFSLLRLTFFILIFIYVHRSVQSETISLLLLFPFVKNETAPALPSFLAHGIAARSLHHCPKNLVEQVDAESSHSPNLFNPFKDFVLLNDEGDHSFPQKKEAGNKDGDHIKFSTFNCMTTPSVDYPNWVRRTCRFENLYYDAKKMDFQYFASPEESALYNWDADALREAFTTNNGMVPFDVLELNKPDWVAKEITGDRQERWKFAPTVVLPTLENNLREQDRPILASIQHPAHPVFILYQPSWGSNIGHAFFEYSLEAFLMLENFDLSDIDGNESPAKTNRKYQHVPFALGWYRCGTEKRNCLKMLNKVVPKIMGISMTNNNNETDIFRIDNAFRGQNLPPLITRLGSSGQNTDREAAILNGSVIIRIPDALSGTVNHSYLGCMRECVAHRVSLMYRYRKWIFQNMFGFKTGSIYHELCTNGKGEDALIVVALPIGNSHKEGVDYRNLDDLKGPLQQKYGESRVKAVDLATLPIDAQAALLAKTKVLITNHGGGSSTCLFLQKGSTAITVYSFDNRGHEMRRDDTLYDSIPYFRTDWIPVTTSVSDVIEHVEYALTF